VVKVVKVVKVYEYSTLKIEKPVLRKLRKLKAKMMLESQAHVSDNEVVKKIVNFAEAHENEVIGEGKKTGSILDLAGIIKGGKRFNAEKEIDKTVYGV